MQCYTFDLDDESQELVIITPFGKYKYKCLPMGLKCDPVFAHQLMKQVMCKLNNVEIYLDDIGGFGNT